MSSTGDAASGEEEKLASLIAQIESIRAAFQELKKQPPSNLVRDQALQYAERCAEIQVQLFELANSKTDRFAMKERFESIVDAAEKIKTSSSSTPPIDLLADLEPIKPVTAPDGRSKRGTSATPPDLLGASKNSLKPPQPLQQLFTPASTRKIPNSEKIYLWRSSRLNGSNFPPWENEPDDKEFLCNESGEKFQDDCNLRLSDDQKEMLDGWKRPDEAFPPPSLRQQGFNQVPTMEAKERADLVQDAATDCSVVASLCAAVARGQAGHPRILSSIMFPYDPEKESPIMTENGKYIFRLNFNGCPRKVVIDDRLPVSKTPRIMHVTDRANPGLFWPALLEKAYLKIYGGYDFPGSNSGTDLWVMTGWIPEHILLDHPDTDLKELWSRMFLNFQRGHVIITMGTGNMSAEAEDDLGLAGEHDYAVLDLQEHNGQKYLFVKNPWMKSAAYKAFRAKRVGDGTSNETSTSQQSNNGLEGEIDTASKDMQLIDIDTEQGPGTFWINLQEVEQHFQSIYLNWTPNLFKYHEQIHFRWDLLPSSRLGRSAQGSFSKNPQYMVSTNKEGGVGWFLISKHFKDRGSSSESSGKQQSGYMALYAFKGNGKRVYLSKGAMAQGQFVDSPQTLLRLTLQPNSRYTIVLSEQDLPSDLHSFTLSAFSEHRLTIVEAPDPFPHFQSMKGAWKAGSAGGSANLATYFQNPQFTFSLTKPSNVALFLETMNPKLSVHIKVVYSGGERIYKLLGGTVVADSGDYRHGCALIRQLSPLEAGTYSVICSTFEAGQEGEFTLKVDSDMVTELKAVPKEGAGQFRKILSVATFGPNARTLTAPVRIRGMCSVKLIAQHIFETQDLLLNSPTRSPIRMSIELGTGPYRSILIASSDGNFSDAPSGIRTETINVAPQTPYQAEMYFVLERMGVSAVESSVEEQVQVELLTDVENAVQVGVWRFYDR